MFVAVDTIAAPDHGHYRAHAPAGQEESSGKAFQYFIVASAGMGYAGFIKHEVTNFLSALNPSADVMAMANMEFDIKVRI